MEPQGPRDRHWLDDARNVDKVYYTLLAVCLLLVLLDVGGLLYHKHGHFGFENWWGFHGLFGFAAFVFLVLAGKQWRRVVMRDKDYYDR